MCLPRFDFLDGGKLHTLGIVGDALGVWQRSGGIMWGSKCNVDSQICSVKGFWQKGCLSRCQFLTCKFHFSCWFSSFYVIPHLSPGSKPQVLLGVSALQCDCWEAGLGCVP